MTDPIESLADSAIDAGVKAVESVVPHPVAPVLDAILNEGAAALKAEVPLLVQDIEGAVERFAAFIRERVLVLIHPIPPAVMELSDGALRKMLEALAARDFDVNSEVRLYANWTARSVADNAINLRNEAARRGWA